jgi:hypothetical protein
MRVLATDRVGDGGAPIVAAELSDGDRAPSITRWVAPGTLVVLTDTATTEGCPGRPDSEDALLACAEVWMRTFGQDLFCVALQIGFDPGGRPRAVLAVSGGGDEGGAHGVWDGPDDAVEVETLPCTVVTFIGSLDDRAVMAYDVEAELLRDMRSWMHANPDFACEAVQLAHDPTGRPQAVLVGGGLTAGASGAAFSAGDHDGGSASQVGARDATLPRRR